MTAGMYFDARVDPHASKSRVKLCGSRTNSKNDTEMRTTNGQRTYSARCVLHVRTCTPLRQSLLRLHAGCMLQATMMAPTYRGITVDANRSGFEIQNAEPSAVQPHSSKPPFTILYNKAGNFFPGIAAHPLSHDNNGNGKLASKGIGKNTPSANKKCR